MPRPSSLARWSTATSLLLLLLPPAAAAEPDVDAIDARLAYAEDPSRLDLLGDLTVGSTPVTSVCLCTDRQPGKEECVELADACARPGGPERQALPAALANGHQVSAQGREQRGAGVAQLGQLLRLRYIASRS